MYFQSEPNVSQIEARKAFREETGVDSTGDNLGSFKDEDQFFYNVKQRKSFFNHGNPPVYFGKMRDGSYIFVYDENHINAFGC